MQALVLLAVLALVVLVFWYGYHRKKQRRLALASFGSSHGLQFSSHDPFALLDHRFTLFSAGDGRGCENVLWGTWRGLLVKEADYWYYTTSSDSKGNTSRDYHYFSVVVADLGATLPRLSLQKENLLTRFADHLGFHDIDFESEEFNRRFQVKAEDRRFAYLLVDARMMHWLLGTGGTFGFEVLGSHLLAWCGRRKPSQVAALLDAAASFRDNVPRVVWAQYGAEPPRAGEQTERSSS